MSSRTELYDDVVDVTSFSALDVVEIKVVVVVVVVGSAGRSCNNQINALSENKQMNAFWRPRLNY